MTYLSKMSKVGLCAFGALAADHALEVASLRPVSVRELSRRLEAASQVEDTSPNAFIARGRARAAAGEAKRAEKRAAAEELAEKEAAAKREQEELAFLDEEKRNEAATKIQARARGNAARKELEDKLWEDDATSSASSAASTAVEPASPGSSSTASVGHGAAMSDDDGAPQAGRRVSPPVSPSAAVSPPDSWAPPNWPTEHQRYEWSQGADTLIDDPGFNQEGSTDILVSEDPYNGLVKSLREYGYCQSKVEGTGEEKGEFAHVNYYYPGKRCCVDLTKTECEQKGEEGWCEWQPLSKFIYKWEEGFPNTLTLKDIRRDYYRWQGKLEPYLRPLIAFLNGNWLLLEEDERQSGWSWSHQSGLGGSLWPEWNAHVLGLNKMCKKGETESS